MSEDKVFPVGMFIKPPHERAPDFVKGKVSVKVAEFVEWAQGLNKEWLNMDIKVSQGGKLYMEVDTWEPSGSSSEPAKVPQSGNSETKPFNDDVPW